MERTIWGSKNKQSSACFYVEPQRFYIDLFDRGSSFETMFIEYLVKQLTCCREVSKPAVGFSGSRSSPSSSLLLRQDRQKSERPQRVSTPEAVPIVAPSMAAVEKIILVNHLDHRRQERRRRRCGTARLVLLRLHSDWRVWDGA